MDGIVSQSWGVFFVITLLSLGLAYMAAQSCALGWKSLRLALVYGALIVGANRFLLCALRGADFFNPLALVITCLVIGAIIIVTFQYFRMTLMIKQYPWLYERKGFSTYSHKVTHSTVFM
jgi:hypothetical protein